MDFPGGSVVKNPSANAGDTDSIPDPGRYPHTSEQLSHVLQLLGNWERMVSSINSVMKTRQPHAKKTLDHCLIPYSRIN